MNMKLTGIILAGFLTYSFANAETFKSPDILIDSKLDYDWSGVLVSKFRLLLKNYKLSDPFVGHFPGAVMLNESEVGAFLSQDSKDLLSGFGNAVGLNMLQAETKVWMHDFSYDVKGFSTDLKASEVQADGLVIATDFSASQVSMKAEKISFALNIPGKNNTLPVLHVDIIRPVIRATEDKLINFFAKIKIQDNKDFYKFQIQKANFDQMAKGLLSRPQDIALDYERIIVPEVSIKVGNKSVTFSPEKIEKYLRDNHEAIKGMLLAQAASTLKLNTTEAAFKVLEQYKINKEHWLDTADLKSQFLLGHFSSDTTGENIELNLPGDFCTTKKFDELQEQCLNNKETKTSATRLNSKLHHRSVSVMKDLMASGDANIVASISEDYLNKLLVTTYDAGLWKEALEEAGVALGPNKVIMRLDKRGDSGTLIMDVIYKPSKFEKVLTGSKVIRFPLVLDVSVRIEKHDGEPVLIIRLNDVDTSDETLINGRPENNIVSSVKDVPRFKTKVAGAIRSQLSVLKNKDLIELRFPEFSGLGLDKVDFLSDGNGRMNAIMRLEDLIEEN